MLIHANSHTGTLAPVGVYCPNGMEPRSVYLSLGGQAITSTLPAASVFGAVQGLVQLDMSYMPGITGELHRSLLGWGGKGRKMLHGL